MFSTQSFNIGIAYRWSGFLPPFKNNGEASFIAGSPVNLKFTLTGVAENAGDVGARLYIAQVINGVVQTEQPATAGNNSNEDNLFRYNGNQYHFLLATRGLAAGTYQLRVDLGDGVSRTEIITLRSPGKK